MLTSFVLVETAAIRAISDFEFGISRSALDRKVIGKLLDYLMGNQFRCDLPIDNIGRILTRFNSVINNYSKKLPIFSIHSIVLMIGIRKLQCLFDKSTLFTQSVSKREYKEHH